MIEMECNALTYAGHTVWNVQNGKSPDGGYVGGRKRKPRAEWLIQERTHEPIITTDEAEIILTGLESRTISDAVSAATSGMSDYLLTGLLCTADGSLNARCEIEGVQVVMVTEQTAGVPKRVLG